MPDETTLLWEHSKPHTINSLEDMHHYICFFLYKAQRYACNILSLSSGSFEHKPYQTTDWSTQYSCKWSFIPYTHICALAVAATFSHIHILVILFIFTIYIYSLMHVVNQHKKSKSAKLHWDWESY